MDAMEAILSRQSIRNYTKEPVSSEIITDLLKAGMAAPSSENSQPWHFIIIDERRILNRIPLYYPYAFMTRRAPMAILVCGDENACPYADYWTQDCAAAVENIFIAAVAKGLGMCWCGAYLAEKRQETSFNSWLGIPDNFIPFAILAIGYPAEQKMRPDRFKPDRIHYNKW